MIDNTRGTNRIKTGKGPMVIKHDPSAKAESFVHKMLQLTYSKNVNKGDAFVYCLSIHFNYSLSSMKTDYNNNL